MRMALLRKEMPEEGPDEIDSDLLEIVQATSGLRDRLLKDLKTRTWQSPSFRKERCYQAAKALTQPLQRASREADWAPGTRTLIERLGTLVGYLGAEPHDWLQIWANFMGNATVNDEHFTFHEDIPEERHDETSQKDHIEAK
jgi:hypothetical protein